MFEIKEYCEYLKKCLLGEIEDNVVSQITLLEQDPNFNEPILSMICRDEAFSHVSYDPTEKTYTEERIYTTRAR